jgi:hypothetical protein
MEKASQPQQVPVAQISETLEKTIADLDHARAADLAEMGEVRTAKFAGLARDRDRLAAKLGATHPRVLALDGSLALHAQTSPGFASEIAASSVTPPSVNQSSWALHGNVIDESRAPVPGVTVALYQKDVWAQRLGFACTDANGYFVLIVQGVDKADSGSFSTEILRAGKIIYIDRTPVTIQAGHVEYREIVIGTTPNTCSPPSGGPDAPPSPPTQPAPTTAPKPRPAAKAKGSDKK